MSAMSSGCPMRLRAVAEALAALISSLACSQHAEVAENGVYVGRLYLGAAIEHSAFHAETEAAKAAGAPIPEWPTADPAHLADMLWTTHSTKAQQEAIYPEGFFDR